MKLRIKGNSLRLRVTKPELARLVAGDKVEETIQFGAAPDEKLTYVLQVGHPPTVITEDPIHALFRLNQVRVTLSPAAVRRWRTPDQVGLENLQPVGDGETLHVLVEKDFACIDGPVGSEDPDAFPHPTVGKAC
jgi:hypothetical protein